MDKKFQFSKRYMRRQRRSSSMSANDITFQGNPQIELNIDETAVFNVQPSTAGVQGQQNTAYRRSKNQFIREKLIPEVVQEEEKTEEPVVPRSPLPKGVRQVVLEMHSPRPELNEEVKSVGSNPPVHFINLGDSDDEHTTPQFFKNSKQIDEDEEPKEEQKIEIEEFKVQPKPLFQDKEGDQNMTIGDVQQAEEIELVVTKQRSKTPPPGKRKSIQFDLKNPEPPAYEKPVSQNTSKRKSLLKTPSLSVAEIELDKKPDLQVVTISIEKPVTTPNWIQCNAPSVIAFDDNTTVNEVIDKWMHAKKSFPMLKQNECYMLAYRDQMTGNLDVLEETNQTMKKYGVKNKDHLRVIIEKKKRQSKQF